MKKKETKQKRPAAEQPRSGWHTLLLILELVLITVALLLVYGLSVRYRFYEIVMWIYLILLCGAITAFVILNRGAAGRKTKPEDLPSEWTFEEKQAYLDDEQRRRNIAKKLALLILPLAIVFFVDLIDLYCADGIRDLLSSAFSGKYMAGQG